MPRGELLVTEEVFGPYRLERLLGRGGMGEVHKAYDNRTDRHVALKRLRADLADDVEYQARFRRECTIVARPGEPHIIPIHAHGEINGRLYLEMRLVEGRDLDAIVADESALAPDRAVDLVAQVARALDAAHAAGVVHRDVKPSNVLVTGPPGDEFAYLIDFGIARSTETTTHLTRRPGTLLYMAPERFGDEPATTGPTSTRWRAPCTPRSRESGRCPRSSVRTETGLMCPGSTTSSRAGWL